jgi:hypothetical protein
MKTARIIAVLLLTAGTLVAQSAGDKSFEMMKSLVGDWQGKSPMGDTVVVTYRLTAGGSALISEIQGEAKGKSEDMVSMIHLDGGRVLLTHYCAAGNQPRMTATASADGKSVKFDFLDATNLVSPESGHMHSVVFTFTDAHHHSEEWHFLDHGKEMVERFELEKKS